MIKKISLGQTMQQISCMGLGTMYFGSKVSEQTSFDIMDVYAQAGGSFLDSANKYASWIPGFEGGESEQLIGKWMKSRRNRNEMFVSSKVGFAYGNVPRSLKRDVIISECEKSLKRMGVDVIDLYFAHSYDTETHVEESMEAFYQLKKSGKIRFAGASNYYGWQLLESNNIAQAQGFDGFCCLQQRHTYLEPTLRANFGSQLLLTPDIQSLCKSKNITMMAYSPLLGGAYMKSGFDLPVQYQTASTNFKLANLNSVASDLQVSANAVVLAWMIQGELITVPIVTGSSTTQMEQNLKVLTIELTNDQMELLNHELVQPNKY
jgi:aryl-alcohol dehydrogenase-like predicted oxidoreductase